MKKLVKIENPSVKGVFTRWIKEELKKRVKNVQTNLSNRLEFYLYNDNLNDYSLDYGINTKYANCANGYVCGTDPFHKGGLYVENFTYGNGFNLNQNSTDKQLTKVAHRIIEDYNAQIEQYEMVEPQRLILN